MKPKSEMILDGHAHLGSWSQAWYPGLSVDWRRLDDDFAAIGLSGGVITSTDTRDHKELFSLPDAAKGRYWLFPWIDPNDLGDIKMLEQHAAQVAGLKIHPSANKVAMNDARLDPYLQLARERGWAILVHCGRWQEMSSYKQALEAAAKHTEVPFLLAHMGGDTPPLATAAQDALAEGGQRNVWFGLEGLREYWIVARGIERLGVERFLYGSDYPIGHPRMYLGAVDALQLTPEERGLLLGGNLLHILEGRWREE